jgi:hypothetical protein
MYEEIKILRSFIESGILQKLTDQRVGYYWKRRDHLLFCQGCIAGFMIGSALGIVALIILYRSVT